MAILAGVGLLVVLSLIIYFSRRTSLTYGPEDTPEGVVRNYVVALQQRDYERAYAYLAESDDRPDPPRFRQPFATYQDRDVSLTGIEITDTALSSDGRTAMVYLSLQRGGSGPFDSGYRENNTAELVLQNGAWKIRSMPYPFWSYDWPVTTPADFKTRPETAP